MHVLCSAPLQPARRRPWVVAKARLQLVLAPVLVLAAVAVVAMAVAKEVAKEAAKEVARVAAVVVVMSAPPRTL